jgi:hypothetical protein
VTFIVVAVDVANVHSGPGLDSIDTNTETTSVALLALATYRFRYLGAHFVLAQD